MHECERVCMSASLRACVKIKTLIVISLILVYIIEKVLCAFRAPSIFIADIALTKNGIFPPQKK